MDTNFLRQKISELTKKYSSKKVSIDEDLSLSDDFSLGEDDTVKYHPKPDDFATNRSGDNKNTPYSENKLLDLDTLNSPKVITPRSTSLRSGKGKELIDTPRARSINSLQNSEHSKSLNSPQGSGIVVDEVDNYSDLFSDKELENPQEIKEDNYSDLLSDEELENPQEIDEDSDDSSDYEPFKNIHLVSDDFLEDIQTASETSLNNSENADERLTNRSTRSTPRSIRSIPLSPFISSPVIGRRSETRIKEVTSENESIIEEQLESDINVSENYKSSFEEEKDSSDSGSRTLKKSSGSGSGTLKKSSESGSGALEKQKSSREDSSSSRSNSGKSEENFESSTSASIVKTLSESSLKQEFPLIRSRSSGNLSGNDGEVLVTDEDNNSSKSDQHLNSSTIRKRGKQKRNVIEEEIEKRGRQREEKRGILRKEKREEQKKEERGREEEKSLNNPIELIKSDDSYSEVITELEDFDENDQDNKNKPSDYFKKSEESPKIVDEKIKRKSEPIPHTNGLKHSVNKPKKLNNKHVQCDLSRFQRSQGERVPIYYDFEPTYREESIFNRIQHRRRPIDIDTRVKSLPNRPVITTNIKLFDENQLGKDLDFHIDCDNKFEDYNLNPTLAMDRILRNQIDLTKYFMESHHKMYMACCKIVKSMNEDYKNDGVCQDNR